MSFLPIAFDVDVALRPHHQRTGHGHDAQCVTYRGPEEDHQGREISSSANETALSITDVTDRENSVALSSASCPNVGVFAPGLAR